MVFSWREVSSLILKAFLLSENFTPAKRLQSVANGKTQWNHTLAKHGTAIAICKVSSNRLCGSQRGVDRIYAQNISQNPRYVLLIAR